MGKGRLEAFSDCVISIIMTIMVLELKVPHGEDLAALTDLVPVFLCYVMSFLYIAIYWNNHHHLLHTCRRVTGPILWANQYLLFWLSLFPFVTGWLGQNHFAAIPSAVYGVVLLMAASAYFILQKALLRAEGTDSILGKALGADVKGKLSLTSYCVGIVLSFQCPGAAQLIYAGVALMWLIPDRRIERVLPGKLG